MFSRVAWDTRRGFDNQEPRPIYVGNYEDWDPEETSKQRWTKPTTPGAKKAIHSKEDPEVFKIGRYLCCHDPECGVSVKVVQASKVTWHFKRQWNYGDNPAHRNKCKNERMYRGGESMYHNTTTRTIARLLTPGKKLGGKIIAEKAEWEVFRNFEIKDGKSVKLKPDVYVEFTDGTWFAIEVVFGHPPERTAHDAYGTNMVELDLKKLRVVDSEQSFFGWIREGGIEKALQQESKIELRVNRHKIRNEIFARYDEKQHLAAREEEISRCITKFGFYISPKILGEIDKIENIEDVFVQEQKLIKKLNRIQKAIYRNVEQYGEWTSHIPKSPSDFASVTEVDKWYQQEDKMVQKRRSIENAIARNAKKYGETLSRSAESFSLVREVDEYYQTELGEAYEKRKNAKKRSSDRKKAQKIIDAEMRKQELEEKRQWDEINMEFPEYKQWITGLLTAVTRISASEPSKSTYMAGAIKHCEYLESDLRELITIRGKGYPFLQKLIQQNLISSLPHHSEWDKWGEVDKLLKSHTLTSLEVVRIAYFGKYGGGVQISYDIHYLFDILFPTRSEDPMSTRVLDKYMLTVIGLDWVEGKTWVRNLAKALSKFRPHRLFERLDSFTPDFSGIALLDKYSEGYTCFGPSLREIFSEGHTYFEKRLTENTVGKLDLARKIIDFVESNNKVWKGLDIESKLENPTGLRERVDREIERRKKREQEEEKIKQLDEEIRQKAAADQIKEQKRQSILNQIKIKLRWEQPLDDYEEDVFSELSPEEQLVLRLDLDSL